MGTVDDVKAVLEDAIQETGATLAKSTQDVAAYVAERSAYLQTIPNSDPGFPESLRAERDAILIEAGLRATAAGDATDAKIVGVVTGIVGVLARLPAPA